MDSIYCANCNAITHAVNARCEVCQSEAILRVPSKPSSDQLGQEMTTPPTKYTGMIYLVSGPSGAGKTTLIRELVHCVPNLSRAVTVTTRRPRPGEIPGIDYYFVSNEQFTEMQTQGKLLEWDHIYNEYYGVPRDALNDGNNNDTIIIITSGGAHTIQKQLANTVSIFIMPPSRMAAATGISARQCPNEDLRLLNYENEIMAVRHYDHVVLNVDFMRSLEQLKRIIEHRDSMSCVHTNLPMKKEMRL